MVVNIELLHGATVEYQGCFYVLKHEGGCTTITELFTGMRCADSETEANVMRIIMNAVEKQREPF